MFLDFIGKQLRGIRGTSDTLNTWIEEKAKLLESFKHGKSFGIPKERNSYVDVLRSSDAILFGSSAPLVNFNLEDFDLSRFQKGFVG